MSLILQIMCAVFAALTHASQMYVYLQQVPCWSTAGKTHTWSWINICWSSWTPDSLAGRVLPRGFCLCYLEGPAVLTSDQLSWWLSRALSWHPRLLDWALAYLMQRIMCWKGNGREGLDLVDGWPITIRRPTSGCIVSPLLIIVTLCKQLGSVPSRRSQEAP